MNLADALLTKTYVDGAEIIRQGEPGDDMYFVEEGRVDISATSNNVDKHVRSQSDVLNVKTICLRFALLQITTITPGGMFGEIALVTQKPRQATATANGKVKCAGKNEDFAKSFQSLHGPKKS